MTDTSLVFNLVARDRASQALGSLKEKFKTGSAAIGAAMGVGVAAAVTSSLDMTAANSKLQAQLGIGNAEAAKLAKVSASVYSNAWGESTTEVNEAIKGVYQQIGDTSQAEGGLEGVTTKVLALSETFDQDLGGTTAAVGQMIKTGLAANADEALDILTRGFQTGADKAGDLLDTMTEYGTQFRKFGLDGQTATGLLSQGLKAGARDADTVADAIKEFAIRGVDGSKATAAGFQAVGLNAGKMTAQIAKGGTAATDAMGLTLDKLRAIHDPVKRNAAAVALFGTKAEDLGDALYALDPSTAVKALGDVGGAAGKMADAVGNNPAAALESFKRQAEVKLAEVGGIFVTFAMKHQSTFKPLAVALAGVAATVLVIRGAMMVWTAAQAAWSAATAIATAVQWAWNASLWANPITWIIIAVIAFIAIIVLLWMKVDGFRNFFKAAWDVIWGALKGVWNWLKQNWPMLLAIITGPIGMAVWLVTHYWDKITAATSAAWDAVWGFVKSVPGRIYSLFLNWTFPGLIIKHWSSIKSNTIRIAVATVKWVQSLPGRFVSAVSSLGNRVSGAASSAWGRFRTGTINKAMSAVSWVKGLPGRVKGALGSNLAGALYNSGRALLRGFVDGIKSMGSAVKDSVGSIVSGARDLLPFSPAKEGPFSGRGWTLYSGQSLVNGFAQGISSRAGAAKQAMTDVVSDTAGKAGLAAGAPAPGPAAPMSRTRQGAVVVRFEMGGADGEFKKFMRKIVRVNGRGNVQIAFGG